MTDPMTPPPATLLQTALARLEACNESRLWVGERDLATAWAECERGDWMNWALAVCGPWCWQKIAGVMAAYDRAVRPALLVMHAAEDVADAAHPPGAERAAAYAVARTAFDLATAEHRRVLADSLRKVYPECPITLTTDGDPR